MSDEQTPGGLSDVELEPGWQVIDPDGNVVDSGPLSHAEPVTNVGESEEQ